MAAPVLEKRFLIPVKRPWKLWLWPLLAIAYFAWVLFLALGNYEVPGVTMDQWVLGGLGLFGFVLFVELLLLIRRKSRGAKMSRRERKAAKAAAAAAETAPEAAPEAGEFARPGVEAVHEAPAVTPAVEDAPAHEAEGADTFTPPPAAPEAAADDNTFTPPPTADAEAPAPEAPAATAAPKGPDAEIRAPGEQMRGRDVVEVSLPPKSRNHGALYAKAYVPIGTDLVVRIETLAAEPSDF